MTRRLRRNLRVLMRPLPSGDERSPARIALAWMSSNAVPAAWSAATAAGSKGRPAESALNSFEFFIHAFDHAQSPKASICSSTWLPSGSA